jgi:hypothetical protein
MDGVNGGTARANERYLLISPSVYRQSLSKALSLSVLRKEHGGTLAV